MLLLWSWILLLVVLLNVWRDILGVAEDVEVGGLLALAKDLLSFSGLFVVLDNIVAEQGQLIIFENFMYEFYFFLSHFLDQVPLLLEVLKRQVKFLY